MDSYRVRAAKAAYQAHRKTMLVRTVADGGESFYIKGKHSDTIPALWGAIKKIVD